MTLKNLITSPQLSDEVVSRLLIASVSTFSDLTPEHAPERFVFPRQPLPKFSEALRAGQETP